MGGDDKELTAEQLRELGAALAELEAELDNALALARDSGKPVELDQSAVGRVSRGDALQQQQMSLATARNAERRLAQVKRARAPRTPPAPASSAANPSPTARLRSRPETALCLQCQSEHEGS